MGQEGLPQFRRAIRVAVCVNCVAAGPNATRPPLFGNGLALHLIGCLRSGDQVEDVEARRAQLGKAVHIHQGVSEAGQNDHAAGV